jgi:hypothetical protein
MLLHKIKPRTGPHYDDNPITTMMTFPLPIVTVSIYSGRTEGGYSKDIKYRQKSGNNSISGTTT